jgi:hypothetical protein
MLFDPVPAFWFLGLDLGPPLVDAYRDFCLSRCMRECRGSSCTRWNQPYRVFPGRPDDQAADSSITRYIVYRTYVLSRGEHDRFHLVLHRDDLITISSDYSQYVRTQAGRDFQQLMTAQSRLWWNRVAEVTVQHYQSQYVGARDC